MQSPSSFQSTRPQGESTLILALILALILTLPLTLTPTLSLILRTSSFGDDLTAAPRNNACTTTELVSLVYERTTAAAAITSKSDYRL